MTVAIPSISSSMERTKVKQDKAKKKVLIAAAEMYVTDNKNFIYKQMGDNDSYCIEISTLEDNGYLSDDATKNSNGDTFNGSIEFTKPNNYEYQEKVCNNESAPEQS